MRGRYFGPCVLIAAGMAMLSGGTFVYRTSVYVILLCFYGLGYLGHSTDLGSEPTGAQPGEGIKRAAVRALPRVPTDGSHLPKSGGGRPGADE